MHFPTFRYTTLLSLGTLALGFASACSSADTDVDALDEGEDASTGSGGSKDAMSPVSTGGTDTVPGSGGAPLEGSGGSETQLPVDCSAITASGFELCSSSETTCDAVFTDGAGCSAVCAAAGLTCLSAAEDADGLCAANDALPAVACDSGHQSDYCRCGGSHVDTGTGGAPGAGGTPGTGGVPGTGGTGGGDSNVDADGCPITQQGFSTTSALGQDGTTGGLGGPVVTVTNQADLESYAGASEPYIIHVEGKITISPLGKEVRIASHKSIIGVGSTGEISQGGFFIGTGNHNIIIRNLTIGDTYKADDPEGKDQDWDGVQMDTANHVWIDHCDFHHGGDGLIDSRKDTTNLTVSWSLLRDHNKTFGIGWTDNVSAEMTIHHNILRNTGQRNPSIDNVLHAHLFNNWLENVSSYGNYARGGTHLVLENSVFESVNNPHYYDTGSLVAIGNVYSSTSGQQESSGSSYDFFNPADYYSYDLDPASEVKALLTKCTGPRPTLGN